MARAQYVPDDYDSGIPPTTDPYIGVVDGEIVMIGLIGSGPSFDAATARRLAQALVSAADQLDGG